MRDILTVVLVDDIALSESLNRLETIAVAVVAVT